MVVELEQLRRQGITALVALAAGPVDPALQPLASPIDSRPPLPLPGPRTRICRRPARVPRRRRACPGGPELRADRRRPSRPRTVGDDRHRERRARARLERSQGREALNERLTGSTRRCYYKLVSRVGALLMLAAIAIMFCPTSVWALGPAAPPRITFAAAWVNTFVTAGGGEVEVAGGGSNPSA